AVVEVFIDDCSSQSVQVGGNHAPIDTICQLVEEMFEPRIVAETEEGRAGSAFGDFVKLRDRRILSQAIQEFGGQLPENGMHLYVADTLEEPQSGTNRELSYTLQLIAQQRQRTNRVKLETPIQVYIGNPPYTDKSESLGA